MVPFAGWLMPVQYTSIVEEHQAVRNNVGIFDISHMGQFIVDGANARDWLNRMLTNNVDKLDVGVGQYTFLLNERGGIIDDLIVYRIHEQKYLLVVNAARADEDFAWLQNRLKEGRSPGRPSGGPSFAEATAGKLETAAACTLASRSANFGAVAIQGPQTMALFHALFGKETELPARNHIVNVSFDTANVSVARTREGRNRPSAKALWDRFHGDKLGPAQGSVKRIFRPRSGQLITLRRYSVPSGVRARSSSASALA